MIDDVIFEQLPAGGEAMWSRGRGRSELGRSIVAWREAVRGSIPWVEMLEFTDRIQQTRDPATIHKELLRFAMQWTQASRVELVLEGSPRRVLGRPVGASTRGSEPFCACEPVKINLNLWGRDLGELRIILEPGKVLAESIRRQIDSLASLAITADRALRAELNAGFSSALEPMQEQLGPSFILPFLNQLTQMARRRQEPLAVFGIGLDRAKVIGEMLGPKIVEEAMRRISRSVVGTLRSSDLVVQLDDHRLIAMLPEVPIHAAPKLAEAIGRAVRISNRSSKEMPGLGVSVGVALFPDHAEQAESLLASALEALRQAQSLGRDRVLTWFETNKGATVPHRKEPSLQVMPHAS